MRYLNSVYIRDYKARVGYRRGSLVVTGMEGKQRIGIEAIDAVIMFAGQITTDALAQLVRRRVRIAALTRGGRIRFIVSGPTSGNVHLRQAQHRAADDVGTTLQITRNIVAAKLQNSRRVIARWGRDYPQPAIREDLRTRSEQLGGRVTEIANADSAHMLRGIEGDAGRLHFGAVRKVLSFEELQFTTRNRRPPRDPVNALLGMCYALLVTEATGAAETVGLDPQIGFFHRARSGRASLSLDLVEEFRPLVDRFVVGIVRRKQIGVADFTFTAGGACYLTDSGRDRLLKLWEKHKDTEFQHDVLGRPVSRWALPTVQATLMARHLRGDLPGYPPFLLRR
ncbi:MAG: CRISPR-associated endonuclease Cas1 [Gammaproteobacteria bacterium]|nr:CRISPR-associated endonuclease Cas1 [Acidimicrobiia bacterium]MYB79398.1 CRISPR-associated endonuclease Cas1 [Acidimicrobiia bacterium]MYC61202.1 CRISPR-associated endonuclease Cas1 [Gammaproteobacteria bacterium]MYH05260.1 CRISPR-associated endonuclease Cas1 [Acidimicrobiia bacterium]MYK56358.1 CRISPR-associated endonuclease Cas1 [Acidimicrobiia bacterium]